MNNIPKIKCGTGILPEELGKDYWICPRCGNRVKEYPAVSRRDKETYICSCCGTEEALFDIRAVRTNDETNQERAWLEVNPMEVQEISEVERIVTKVNKSILQLRVALETMPFYGEECKCKNKEQIELIHYGEHMEIELFCINCGGYINGRD
jgi:predicted RNA-binding Zn-ribbon protein involved in translation (DUF1610 family)